MLEYGLKDVTKDIDLVCKDAASKARFLEAAKSLGFAVVGPEKRHARLGLDRVAVKGGHTLYIFAGRISYDFGLSETMWERGKAAKILGKAEMRSAAVEDIFRGGHSAARGGLRYGRTHSRQNLRAGG